MNTWNRRVVLLKLLAQFLLIVAACSLSNAQDVVIGYYPTWLRETIPANKVDFGAITHVNHAFAWPLADGTIANDQTPVDTAIINAAHNAGRKILISLGGASESGAFSAVAADSTLRGIFVSNLVKYVTDHHYDGADLDWEFPSSNADKANEVALVRAIRESFATLNTPLLLTMAVGAGNWTGQWRDYANLLPLVNWFNVMTYDFHGSWSSHSGPNSPLYPRVKDNDGSVDQAVLYLQQTRGVPASHIVLGLPFYGVKFTSNAWFGPSTGALQIVYSDIVPMFSQGWVSHWDTVCQVPYLTGPGDTGIVSYDDSLSLTMKCSYAKSHGLAGVMFWALGEDVVAGDQPLMRAVEAAMSGSTEAAATNEGLVPEAVELCQNYPNPFNATTTIRYTVGGVRGQGSGVSNVRLSIYDLLGREVATLVNAGQAPGTYEVRFDGSQLASGVYFYRLTVGKYTAVKEMILQK